MTHTTPRLDTLRFMAVKSRGEVESFQIKMGTCCGVVLLLSGFLGQGTAQTLEITRVGQWPGYPRNSALWAPAVAISGTYAYLADGFDGLHVIDISNPTNCYRVGGAATSGFARDVAVSGNYAYVAASSNGLEVTDISNPADPVRLGARATRSDAQRVAVSGNYGYVAQGKEWFDGGWRREGGLDVFDLRNPANPIRVGGADTAVPEQDVAISGDYAYLSSYSPVCSGLRVVDIRDPTGPVLVGGCFSLGGSAERVVISGNYAYVAAWNGLQVLNVSNPSNLVSIGGVNPGFGPGLAMSGSYAYFAVSSSYYSDQIGLHVIDISNPASPGRTGSIQLGGYPQGVALSGNYACVAAQNAGLHMIDISNPSNPKRVGGFYPKGYAYRVAVHGSYAYVADSLEGLHVIDISNPSHPTRVGSLQINPFADRVVVSGNYAYVAAQASGLQVIDISDPAKPVRVADYVTSDYSYDVAVSGGYAYLTDNGLQVIDIRNPVNPVRVGSLVDQRFRSGHLIVSGRYAYLVYLRSFWVSSCECFKTEGGLALVDVSNPANPVQVGTYSLGDGSRAYGIAVSGHYVYLPGNVLGDMRVQVIDVSNPAIPIRVSGVNSFSFFGSATVSGNYAYVANGYSGFQIIDLGNPTNPAPVVGYDTSGNAEGVAISGNYAYVADGNWGLQVFRVNGLNEVRLFAEVQGSQLLLKWPASATNYVLESATSLPAPQWQAVPGTPQLTNGFCQLAVPATSPTAYFHLRRF